MTRRGVYALCAVGLFLIEVLIATKLAHLGFVRGKLGDVLVTMLVYCAVLAVRDFERLGLAAATFAFACVVEAAQYVHLAQALGLPPGSVLRVMIGDSFSWSDIACYLVGCVIVYGVDRAALARFAAA